MSAAGSSSYLLTVDRALQVLGYFTASSPEWGVSELARASGLDKSQVQRLLATLAGRDFLAADPRTSRYQLGPRLVALGRLAEDSPGVARLSRPLLARLARSCGESAVLCRQDGADYRVVAAADGPGPLRYASAVGDRFPGRGGGASGDVLFAYSAEEQVRTLFDVDAAALAELRQRYARIRAGGYAVSYGEYDPRVTAVAAPVLAQGTVVGSVAVLGPREEMRSRVDEIVAAVTAAARELGARYE